MTILKKNIFVLMGTLITLVLASCGNASENDWPTDGSVKFFYENKEITPTYGEKNNVETYDYDSLKVHNTTNTLRDDFAYGVDASMVYEVEKHGGVYYNEDGKEQDVFQIMRNDGVNFVRFRVWNNPSSTTGAAYGGGNNTCDVDLEMAKRAKAANLNVMLDFHYSDFWADPSKQFLPKEWKEYGTDELYNAITTFTKETMQKFKDNGVTVDAVQIGNEINNGLMFPFGKLNTSSDASLEKISTILQTGITAAKAVFPHCYSIIHLAEGGQKETFEKFFTKLEENEVDYDIIGASYYPYWHGTLDNLQTNLDNITSITKKPVMIMETAWGFTTEENANASNIYDSTLEATGGYLTSVQAQATSLADICNVLSKVPNNLGLGVFYWEPAWLPVSGAGWATAAGQSYNAYGNDQYASNYSDGKASWSNQGLFSYTGKALPSLATYKHIQNKTNDEEEVATKVSRSEIDVVLNLALNQSLPTVFQVETNFDALRNYAVIWNEKDLTQLKQVEKNIVHGVVSGFNVIANVTCK